jgi:hypothetical protein
MASSQNLPGRVRGSGTALLRLARLSLPDAPSSVRNPQRRANNPKAHGTLTPASGRHYCASRLMSASRSCLGYDTSNQVFRDHIHFSNTSPRRFLRLGSRNMCPLRYCGSTQCAFADRTKSRAEIVSLRVKRHDVRTVLQAERTGSEA